MSNRFVPLSECPSLNSDEMASIDYLLASIRDENGRNVFRKISLSNLKDYFKIDYITSLGLESTLSPYLFKIYFNDYDYQYGIDRLESYRNPSSSLNEVPIVYSSAYPNGCTGLHIESFCGHNYDVPFDDYASFVVRTPLVANQENNEITITRHATLSISSRIRRLTKNFVNLRTYDENYKLVPFYVVDGINDSGLCISVNSLPQGEDANFDGTINYHTTGTNPGVGTDVCALMLARILLDKCATTEECINELNNWNVWCPYIDPWKSEFSWDITDALGSTIHLEIVNNEFKIIEGRLQNTNGFLNTNFYQYKWDKNIDNIIIENASPSNPMNTTLTPHSRGLERYKLTKDIVDTISFDHIDDLFYILNLDRYTNLYNNDISPKWYSDYCRNWGDPYGNLTINSSVEDFNPIWNYGKSQYDIQKISLVRLGSTMYTNHSVVYNINDKMMYIKCQEFNKIMEFKL